MLLVFRTTFNSYSCLVTRSFYKLDSGKAGLYEYISYTYTLVLGVARHQKCARPHPREGYNYYTSQMIYHCGGEHGRAMPWTTAEFVTVCCFTSVVSKTPCSHFFGQWSY